MRLAFNLLNFTAMKLKSHFSRLTLIGALIFCCACFFTSCGTTSAYMGVHHDMSYDWDGGSYYGKPYHKHKPPKHKKHKHKKGKKHYRHHNRHHDD